MKTDVVVVGGGIIGCSIAWRLAQQKLRVTVVDQGKIGGESSWAGAGMLAPGGEIFGDGTWARRGVESLRLYPAFCEELTEASGGMAIDFKVTGAREFGEMATLRERAEAQATVGIASVVEHDHVLYPDDAVVNPRDVVAALREACTRLECVTFVEDVAVTEIATGAVSVQDAATLECDWVVVSAGAWSSRLLPEAPAAFPVKGHLIGYWMEPGAIGPIYRKGHHYVLQRQSGYVLAGATTEHVGFDRTVDPHTVEALHKETKAAFPDLPDWPIDSWIGFRPGSHGDPVVGPYAGAERVYLAYGHYRNGILNAPVTARMVCEAVTS
ncbi:glycine oxidase ThiO [Bryobacterales bacterium F-183]|nr:glycine oxidase ThiO [Bryobacterales bacterium F-183]